MILGLCILDPILKGRETDNASFGPHASSQYEYLFLDTTVLSKLLTKQELVKVKIVH